MLHTTKDNKPTKTRRKIETPIMHCAHGSYVWSAVVGPWNHWTAHDTEDIKVQPAICSEVLTLRVVEDTDIWKHDLVPHLNKLNILLSPTGTLLQQH